MFDPKISRDVRLPGCKSLSARALLLAACAQGESVLRGLSDSRDTEELAAALAVLGAKMRPVGGGALVVQGWGGAPEARGVTVDVGEAATSLRMLLPFLAAGRTDVEVRGAPRLFERPHGPLLDFLRDHGAHIEALEPDSQGRPGLRVAGTGLSGGEWVPPIAESSQSLSGLLLAGVWAAPIDMRIDRPIPSAGYVDLTLEAIRSFRGPLAVQPRHGGYLVAPVETHAIEYDVPGDPSAATFFLVALVLCGGSARFREPWSPVHPEARLLRTLFDEGILSADAEGVHATGKAPEHPVEFDLDPAPDAGPALAVLLAHLPRGGRLKRVGRLRLKESDRVAGIQRLLEGLGHSAAVEDDDLCIAGGGLDGGRLSADWQRGGSEAGFDPDGDHRLAMAAGIAALRCPELAVRNAGCVAKSFPRFWEEREAWLDAATG